MLLMATGLRYFLMAVLIAAMEIKRNGCVGIISSREKVFLQEGEKLSLNCTLSYKKEEAMGMIIFWCKKKTLQDKCSSENNLKLLKLKREVEVEKEEDALKFHYASIDFTKPQAKLSDTGIYQCQASNNKNLFQGHYIRVTIIEKRNTTTTEPKDQGDALSNNSERSFKMSFLKEKIQGLKVIGLLLVPGLIALKGL